MSKQARYQVAILGPGDAGLKATLQKTLRDRVRDLGLDPDEHLRFIDEETCDSEVEKRDPLVGAYFGGLAPSAESTRVLKNLVDSFVFVLPIVDSTDSYSRKVPSCLHPLNGMPIDAADPALERIAGRLLEELRLVRLRRMAFVSYRRSEASGVGTQIFHTLEERHYRVFLDTFSVQYGRPFQEVLWNRMLDTDVLVFLHTRGVLGSRWVEEEFARASQLGIGILNVVWPGHTPAPAAMMGEAFRLEPADFVPGMAFDSGDAQLNAGVLRRVAVAVEALRARSLADRRRRVVDAFCRRVEAFVRRTGASDLRVVVQSADHLQVRRGRRRRVRVYPIVGHPDSAQAREIADACSVSRDKGYLLFDSNGIDETLGAHLRWLNDYLPVRSFSTMEVEEWLPRL